MITKNIFLPLLLLVLIMCFSFVELKQSNHSDYKNINVTNFESNLYVDGNKTWNEVRIARRKIIVKVFTDVLTKYKESIPDDDLPNEFALRDQKNRIIQLINKYNL